jgi:hypothetical protein
MIPDPARERIIVLAAFLGVFVAGAILAALHKDVTRGFDELAQTSYVAQAQTGGSLAPDKLRLLHPATFKFSDRGNYLNHPAPYYVALGALGPRLEGQPRAIVVFRCLNVTLAVLGLVALFAIGLPIQGQGTFYAYAVPVLCIPVLVALAGSVNNDNAAFCGGAIALAALDALLDDGRSHWLWLALAGLIISAWAKLTGLLLTGSVVFAVVVYLRARGRCPAGWLVAAGAGLIIAALPYILFMLQYGSPAPETAAQRELLLSGSQLTGWLHAPRLSFAAYAANFVAQFVAGWMPSLASRSNLQLGLLAVPVIAILAAVAGTEISARRIANGKEATHDVLVVACAAAFVLTFTCHLWFSYQRHMATGWMMDAYPRYYLPIAAFVPLAGISAASILPQRWRTAALGFLILGPIAFRFFGAPIS